MKRMLWFAQRNTKEILRDPLSICFGIGFPLVLLLLLSIINNSIPEEAHMTLFELGELTPGICVFGLSFLALFSATLISKDRTSSFVLRLFISPLKGREFFFGYLLPLLPIALVQMAVCMLVAGCMGLPWSINMLLCILICMSVAVVDIAAGFLCGTFLSDKAVGGICGALLTNVSAWLSGTWFSLDLIGGAFRDISYILPYANAVDAGRAALRGDYGGIWQYLWVVLAWAAGLTVLAVICFSHRMKEK